MVEGTNCEAVIFASGNSGIWGGSTDIPTALLPVCGKPLIAHRIDELRGLRVRGLTIVTDHPDELRAALPTLPVHQLKVEIITPDQRPSLTTERVLLTSAEHFAEPVLRSIASATEATEIQARDKSVLGLNLSAEQALNLLSNTEARSFADALSLPSTARCVAVKDVRGLIELNLAVLHGKIATTRISGLELAPQIYLEWCKAARPANIFGPVHIGDGVTTARTARIGNCVIGRGAVIPSRTQLERCVVMDNTTAPRGAHLTDALITENLVLFAEDDAPTLLHDEFDTSREEMA